MCYVLFRRKYIFVNISTSCAFFALKLSDMSLLIIFYCHTKLQLDSMSSFGDFRGGAKRQNMAKHGSWRRVKLDNQNYIYF